MDGRKALFRSARDKNRYGKSGFRNISINYTIVSSSYDAFDVQRPEIFTVFFIIILFELLFVFAEND